MYEYINVDNIVNGPLIMCIIVEAPSVDSGYSPTPCSSTSPPLWKRFINMLSQELNGCSSASNGEMFKVVFMTQTSPTV